MAMPSSHCVTPLVTSPETISSSSQCSHRQGQRQSWAHIFVSPRSSSFNDMFRVGPAPAVFFVSTSLGLHIKQHPQLCSTRIRGRLYGPEFLQMSVRDDIRCVCPPRHDVHITDNTPGYTNGFSATSAHLASSSPSEASWAAWSSSCLAIARLPSSGLNPQTTCGIRVRCTCRHSFPTPHSRGTLSSPTIRVTCSRVGSDTTHRPCRIPMLMDNAKTVS